MRGSFANGTCTSLLKSKLLLKWPSEQVIFRALLSTLRTALLTLKKYRFKFEGSYQVLVFLGPFNDDNPDGWPVEENLVGINGIFSNNYRHGNCENCEAQAKAKVCVMDVIPLTHHLVKWIRCKRKCPDDDDGLILKDLDYEQVDRFLHKNLHWRVADLNLKPLRGHVDFVEVYAIDRVVILPGRYQESVVYEKHGDRREMHGYGHKRDGDYGIRHEERPHYERPQEHGDSRKVYGGEQYGNGREGEPGPGRRREGEDGGPENGGDKCCGFRCVAM